MTDIATINAIAAARDISDKWHDIRIPDQLRAEIVLAAIAAYNAAKAKPDVSGSFGIMPRSERLARECSTRICLRDDGITCPDDTCDRESGILPRSYAEGVIAGSGGATDALSNPQTPADAATVVKALRFYSEQGEDEPLHDRWTLRAADLLEAQSLALRKAREAFEKIEAENARARREFTNVSNRLISEAVREALSLLPKEGE